MRTRAVFLLLLMIGVSAPPQARAQEGLASLQGGVPTGEVTTAEIPLSLTEAIDRGLRYNLGSILGGAAVSAAEGAHKEALADLLPQLRAGVLGSRQKINLAAYGFSQPGMPAVVGPFNVFDARA
jgi:outer membrane protein TolC